MGVDKGAACAAFAAPIILVGAACRTNNLKEMKVHFKVTNSKILISVYLTAHMYAEIGEKNKCFVPRHPVVAGIRTDRMS